MNTDEACTRRVMWCASEMKRQRNEHEAWTRSPIFKIQILGLEPLSQQKLGFFFFGSAALAMSDEHPRQFLSMPEEAQQMSMDRVTGPIIAGALLDMYANQGSICESKRVFSETPHKSQFAWIAIISAYAGHGDYDSVIELFKEMEREGVDLIQSHFFLY
ncbi:unnamed protein product [Prunus armeniaca]